MIHTQGVALGCLVWPFQGRGVITKMRCLIAVLVSLTLAASRVEAADRPVDFDTQIIPLLTKAGCNAGACHGAAIGRGGFKLSLYGGNPVDDYIAIVRRLEGRRVNLAKPDESLLLRWITEGAT